MDVVLVATLPDGDESLGLAYLAASLRQAGHRPRVVTFRGCHDMEDAARRACLASAPLMGVAIPSGHAAIDMLAFINRVRTLGYQGHITCGGAYATLARKRLLDTVPALSSVVRHDGEIPIARLADALSRGASIECLPGLTTRSGEGAPAPVDDRSGMLMRPERDALRLYAGVPSAKISAVRGCWGGCRYCGLAGIRRDALREAAARGLSSRAAASVGVGGMRRRPVDHVADEVAWLYHERGARYFHFVDENHLPRDPVQARDVLLSLDEALSKRRVGRRAISLMLRADVATAEVVDALVRLGVVRCLLGVESNTQEGLTALGRGATPEANCVAVHNLTHRGISFHLNVLLIHPSSTLASIEAEVEALGGIEGGLLDPFQVEVLEGTDLFERLVRSDRVLGGPHLWHFWPEEPGARRFAEAFHMLKREVMGQQQLTAYAYEVLGTLAVAGKLGRLGKLGTGRARLLEESRRQIATHNALWTSLLQEAIAHARDPESEPLAVTLASGRVRAASVTMQFARLARAIHGVARSSLRTEVSYPRTATAAAFAAAVLAASCGGSTTATSVGGGDASVQDSAPEASSDTLSDSPVSEATPADAPPEALLDSVVCDNGKAWDELSALRDEVNSTCDDICTDSHDVYHYRFLLDDSGHVVDMERDDGEPILEETKSCYLAAVEGQVFPCLAEYPQWIPCNIALK